MARTVLSSVNVLEVSVTRRLESVLVRPADSDITAVKVSRCSLSPRPVPLPITYDTFSSAG